MQLSIIIVNYNVRAFLEKCLISVAQASTSLGTEVIVVDNNSLDDSVEMLEARFPNVRLIANARNVGFAAANNQGLRVAQGKYVLLLNPDTVVSEDTFQRCFAFMEEHPDAGAVGVSMLDGTGTWLPESKRGLPSPLSSFFKLTGINSLFPNSGFFNGYYMGGLDPAEIHQVEVLSGAFMFMRMSALTEVGFLDEDYFMYGEDIDLSYRLLKGGYHNYYLPTTSIIHYKGESTKRSSLEYVRTFYRAMLIFVKKNYTGTRGMMLTQFLKLGIFARAALSGFVRVVSRLVVPLIDLTLIVSTIVLVKNAWASWYFGNPGHFDEGFLRVNLPLYAGIWFISLILFGAYSERRSTGNVIRAVLLGTIGVLLAYALLSLPYRSSRAVILISAFGLLIVLGAWSALLMRYGKQRRRPRRIAVVGSSAESARIMELMNRIEPEVTIAGGITVNDQDPSIDHIGQVEVLDKIVETHRIDEVIFSSEDLPFSEISMWMARLSPSVRFKIASGHSDEIVGSDSKKLAGDLYASEIQFAISTRLQRRNKRILDVTWAIASLLLSPLGIFSRRFGAMAREASKVLRGQMSWVSYDPQDMRLAELPQIKPGIWSPGQAGEDVALEANELHMINYLYAREYSIWKDIDIMLRRGTKRAD